MSDTKKDTKDTKTVTTKGGIKVTRNPDGVWTFGLPKKK